MLEADSDPVHVRIGWDVLQGLGLVFPVVVCSGRPIEHVPRVPNWDLTGERVLGQDGEVFRPLGNPRGSLVAEDEKEVSRRVELRSARSGKLLPVVPTNVSGGIFATTSTNTWTG